ncbi:MAG: cobyrinic acid a,c-diamide synthase, partial [Rubrivivax sp.]|nr:cobyrinic acid a,c-diamide synthase [Rubrivivax sp.]
QALAATVPALAAAPMAANPVPGGRRLRIGVARDRAFGFYYPDDLAALQAAGGELVFIDTLSDTRLPVLDGLFIGGGFPEMHMEALQANGALRAALREAIAGGLPVYAECGGLMYLSRRLRWKDRVAEMVGAIPADAVMHERPVGRGYVALRETADFPWPGGEAALIRAHEFHHSSLENLGPGLRFGYRVERGQGIDGQHDGLLCGHVLASYAHRHSSGADGWAPRFVAYVRGIAAVRDAAAASRCGVAA